MDIRVLGYNGSQVLQCNAISFLLNGKILLDTGTVTTSLAKEGQCNIDCVFVTRAHLDRDRVKDIMFLADNIFNLAKDSSRTVYETPLVRKESKTHLFNRMIWPNFPVLPNRENLILKFMGINPGNKIRVDDMDVTAVRVGHGV